jgi:uncharacterized protein (UPF0147 family)
MSEYNIQEDSRFVDAADTLVGTIDILNMIVLDKSVPRKIRHEMSFIVVDLEMKYKRLLDIGYEEE